MDIPKRDDYRRAFLIALTVFSASTCKVRAEQDTPGNILVDSYKLDENAGLQDTEREISQLHKALAVCTDDYLKSRIKYRIGMLYFNSNQLSDALDSFENLVGTPGCGDLVKLCSLNMAGQIYRMQGKDDKALNRFKLLIDFAQNLLAHHSDRQRPAEILPLVVAAGFARAEIYQYQQQYRFAVNEYKKQLVCLASNKAINLSHYAAKALDRISQLHLITDDIRGYHQTTAEIIEKHPDYYRLPIIILETEAVGTLRANEPSAAFAAGATETPARLIALIKDSQDEQLGARTLGLLKDLSGQYQHTYGGIVLGYHYAWLLDTTHQASQAAGIFEGVCRQAASFESDTPSLKSVISLLADYARIQQAVILGEEAKYVEALKNIASVKSDPNDSHLSKLTDSIAEALKTLKREVPKNE